MCYDRSMNTSLKGVFMLSQTAAWEMYKRKSGYIVNIGFHNDKGTMGGSIHKYLLR